MLTGTNIGGSPGQSLVISSGTGAATATALPAPPTPAYGLAAMLGNIPL